jgi:hypothetical protein
MHEAGLLAAAVAEALAAGWPDSPMGPGSAGARRLIAIDITVHDPMHVAPESARLHAELALRARGLEDVAISVSADPVTCVMCEVANEVRAEHPFCAECGWPLPDHGGHAVDAVVRWADDLPAEGSAAEGSAAEGSAAEGSATEGSATEGSAAEILA